MRAHFEEQHRQRQHQSDPEAPAHVEKFFARPLLSGHIHGLKGHAADRAVAGAVLHDLRMHGTGVLRARRRGRWFFSVR